MESIKLRLPFAGKFPITQLFGANPQIYSRFGKPGHNGLDFGLPIGTPVLASAEGTVEKIGYDEKGYGYFILLRHDKFFTLYAHLSKIQVSVQQKVFSSQQIGLSGNTGFSTGPHLHFELRVPGAPGSYNKGEIDPSPFFEAISVSATGIKEGYAGHAVVSVSVLNVRLNPSLSAPVVGSLSESTKVEVISTKNGWCKIALYAKADFLNQAES
jgi:murein DD-endopeptidase MepM/ murein hydrolase activator NlpD